MDIVERLFDNEDGDPIDIVETLAEHYDWDFDKNLPPREIASIPKAPVPAKISKIRACSILISNFPPRSILNKLSFTRSPVGRRLIILSPTLIELNRLPFKVPPMTLI